MGGSSSSIKLDDEVLSGEQSLGEELVQGIVGEVKPYRSDAQTTLCPKIYETNVIPDKKTSQNEFQKVYDEGFKDIYSLENVDLSSVCKLDVPVKLEEKKDFCELEGEDLPYDGDQQLLDFGWEHRDWMESLRLSEPIQVLKLSPQSQKPLLDSGKKNLRDVINLSKADLLNIKGMGQGHVDDFDVALKVYLGEHSLHCVRSIDWISLLHCLLGSQNQENVYSYLSSLGFKGLLPLKSLELTKVRHWTEKREKEVVEELGVYLLSPQIKEFLRKKLDQIFHAFLIPWILRREGIVKESEIMERLQAVSVDRVQFKPVWNLLKVIYGNDFLSFHHCLVRVEDGVWVANQGVARIFRSVRKIARTYFTSMDQVYDLDELIQFMLREYALYWDELLAETVERVLMRSRLFRIRRKGEKRVVLI